MLANNLNDNACFLNERGVCEFFASKLAPTKKPSTLTSRCLNHRTPCASGHLDVEFRPLTQRPRP
ncbi:hypothetical protein C1Y26_29745 [Pseudomonas sp. MPR-R2A7]|nr:hypothetical protein C1Y23_29395 [Pseudomonas sp. GW460-12]PMX29887.1 hypothetical protein C1Y24_31205 [Pseudomonas sp. MPR-R2A4]PMX34142.1 hypothetical protein C1Y26_29745 [Pseudomonas sp. MPR-R2A7]PMX47384.1 hypothetical protein C1Y17_31390 [Pseudomonas sp. MPR-R2A6]PMX82751.1 hypothetical protein C1Y21_30585 [Pseudomonas sp. MPR-R2A3]PMY05845.1 hypothetical protein C1Y22_30585 [Pseudomonas sp. MPR-R2A5]PNA22589.1 hypothetical protein C1Y16_30725 [Pseudomonas sp. MPR-ANB1]PNA37932.1 hyp